MSNGFGTPQYGNSNGPRYENWRLKTPDASKGEQKTSFICRIIPPMKSLAESGKWAFYHGQHFGYAGVNPRDPDKVKQRPFACVKKEDFRTKMVTVACAACDIIDEKFEEKKRREAEYKAQGLSDSAIKERLEPLTAWLKRHNCDRKWHLNVMTPEGKFGVLQIPHSVKKQLDQKIDELREKKKIDPIAIDQGVWFNFTRMGKFPVTDGVEWVMEGFERDGETFERIKKAPLTEEQCKNALEILPDLARETVKFISVQQVVQIVASSGDPEEIDRIWQQGTRTEQRERTPVSARASAPATTPVPQPAATAPAAAPVTTATAPATTSEDDEIAEYEKKIAAMKAAKAAKAAAPASAPAPAPKPAAPTTVTGPASADDEDPESLSDEEFYAKFGVK
jgi:hypothetical protein